MGHPQKQPNVIRCTRCQQIVDVDVLRDGSYDQRDLMARAARHYRQKHPEAKGGGT